MRSKASAIVAPRDWGVMVEKAYSTTKHASDQVAAHSQRGEEINLFHTIRTISVLNQ